MLGREVWNGPHKEARLSLCQVNSILASDMSNVSSSRFLAFEFLFCFLFLFFSTLGPILCELWAGFVDEWWSSFVDMKIPWLDLTPVHDVWLVSPHVCILSCNNLSFYFLFECCDISRSCCCNLGLCLFLWWSSCMRFLSIIKLVQQGNQWVHSTVFILFIFIVFVYVFNRKTRVARPRNYRLWLIELSIFISIQLYFLSQS